MRQRLDPDERRKQILRAARRAFAARPYDEVQIDVVARDAGASRALVNHYFRDKRGLFLAVARQMVERVPSVVRTDLELEVEEMVAANADAWLDFVEAGRETFMLFGGAGPIGGDPEFWALKDELRDRFAERMLANHLGDAEIPPEARFAMRAAIAAMEQAAQDWVTGRGGTRAQTHTLMVEIILATIRRVLPALQRAGDR